MIDGSRLDAYFLAGIGVFAEHGIAGVRALGDGIGVAAAGRGGAEFNTAITTGIPRDADAALDWACGLLAATGRPYGLQIAAPLLPAFAGSLAQRGFERTSTLPGMAMRIPAGIPAPPPGLRVERVADPASLEAHAIAVATGFGAPEPRGALEVFRPSLLDDDRVAMFNGYAGGGELPVATSVGVVAAGFAGIFAVTTHEPYRGRGFGAALTWAAVAACRPVDVAVLQASPLGESVYARMGFRTVHDYHRFARRAVAT